MVDNLLRSEDTAARLGITTNHLRQIQLRGALKWVKKEGNRVYYKAEDVDAYAQKRKPKKKQSNNG